MINEQNYLRALQGADTVLGQVGKFLQYTKRPSAKFVFQIRSDIKRIIMEEVKQNKKKKVQS